MHMGVANWPLQSVDTLKWSYMPSLSWMLYELLVSDVLK